MSGPANPTLRHVEVSTDVIQACLSHALSTEHQEIMGLLIGQIVDDNDDDDACSVASPAMTSDDDETAICRANSTITSVIGTASATSNNHNHTSGPAKAVSSICRIHHSLVLSRKDRQKDRVEVSDESLSMATSVAEAMSQVKQTNLTVVGWYHSHPHITVLPSHVDVRTQGCFQQLDPGFVGLIFSVFGRGRIEVCAFQSLLIDGTTWERVEVPLIVLPNTKSTRGGDLSHRSFESLLTLPVLLLQEEQQLFESFLINEGHGKKSRLEICRAGGTYQSAIHRLVDLQLTPLHRALASRISTLKAKKHALQKTRLPTALDEATKGPSSSHTGIRDAAEAMTLGIPWRSKVHALNSIMTDLTCISIAVLEEDSALEGAIKTVLESTTNRLQSHNVRVEPTNLTEWNLTDAVSARQASAWSPWSLVVDSSIRLPLISVSTKPLPNMSSDLPHQPAEDEGQVDCKSIDFVVATVPTGDAGNISQVSTIRASFEMTGENKMLDELTEHLHTALRLHLW
jgi:BRCA1/BRCA2-containing complex subunit 3